MRAIIILNLHQAIDMAKGGPLASPHHKYIEESLQSKRVHYDVREDKNLDKISLKKQNVPREGSCTMFVSTLMSLQTTVNLTM